MRATPLQCTLCIGTERGVRVGVSSESWQGEGGVTLQHLRNFTPRQGELGGGGGGDQT